MTNNIGTVQQVDIQQQMQQAYLDYAMSVIVSRALPDVRDGLKPVHRRILYAMHDMGLNHSQGYKKSARIVGEVLGKYHPHGDAAVYDAMARLAQDFSMRLPLVDGQGNFGSVDGDPPAAMRYTEARLPVLAADLMADIDRNTVDFLENFDGTLTEPSVLPTKIPNFLVNGAIGIAVGMSTSVPPHNLGEVCDALIFMLQQAQNDEEVVLDDLLRFIHGPDFPTGGILFRHDGRKRSNPETDLLRAAYAVGRGRITLQAKVHIEEMSRNRHRLVVTELPYQTNKANLVEKIADLARDDKIEGIVDLRDESDRHGMRLVIELSRTADPRHVLRRLFRLTAMQGTFSVIMLALVDGAPTTLPLKRALQLFINHRVEVITRRSEHELQQARDRLHILEGLRIALTNLSDVVQTIIRSRSAETAKKNIQKQYKLSEPQATAILNIPLRRLAAMERKKIETEYKETKKRILFLEDLLASPKKILRTIEEEISEVKESYDTPRCTTIFDEPFRRDRAVTSRDLMPNEAVLVAVSRGKRLCYWGVDDNLQPARGRLDDPLHRLVPAHTRDIICLFTADARAVMVPMHQIPVGGAAGDGPALSELVAKVKKPLVAGVSLPVDEGETEAFLFLVSKMGRVKRVALSDVVELRGSDSQVMGLEQEDALVTAFVSHGNGEVILATKFGQAIRFEEEEVRAMGLSALGVWGIKLVGKDQIVGAGLVHPEDDFLVVTRQGMGKVTPVTEYTTQGRYGQGMTTIDLADKDELVFATTLQKNDRVLLISRNRHDKYMRSIFEAERAHAGTQLMSLRGRDKIVDVVMLAA